MGAAVGLFLHYASSLPPDQAFISTIATVLLAGGLFVAVLSGLLHWAAGRPQLLVATVAFVAGVTVAYPFGPAVAPAVNVPGTYSLTLGDIQGTLEGKADCRWAAARAKVENVTVPAIPFPGGEGSLTVEFFGVRVRVLTPAVEYRWAGPEAVTPLDAGSAAFSDDHARGAARVYVLLTQVVDAEVPTELRGTLRWECQPAPA